MLWFAFGVAVVVLLVFGISLYTYFECFHSPANRREDPYSKLIGQQYDEVNERIINCTKRMDEAECEWVSTVSHDGLKLYGRYYHTRDGAPVVILFHGYRSMTLRDSAGGYYLCQKMGFNVLAVDQRAHGRSQGTVISFGIKERWDCLSWTDYVLKRFGNNTLVVLSGLSMGASTVLMATALDLPENVCAIMADCPYSAPADIIRKVCRDRHMPDHLAYPFILLGAKVFGKFDLTETTSVEAVRQAKVPVLLIHGEDDRFVPCQMSRNIYSACASPATLQIIPDAGHGLCYIKSPQRYEEVITKFLWSVSKLRLHMVGNEFIRKELQTDG